MGIKDRMKPLTLVSKAEIGYPGLAVFTFKPTTGEPINNFEAGQYMTFGDDVPKPEGVKFVPRPYSVASSPLVRDSIEFYIVQVDGGEFTPHLFTKPIGSQVWYMGPKGKFTLSRTTFDHYVFIATGTGLAPFISMLRTLKTIGQSRSKTITLMFGNRTAMELGYLDELRGYEIDPVFNFVFIPTISRPNEQLGRDPMIGVGRVNDIFRFILRLPRSGKVDPVLPGRRTVIELIERMPQNRTAYFMCGNPDMVKDGKEALAAKSWAAPESIFSEDYW